MSEGPHIEWNMTPMEAYNKMVEHFSQPGVKLGMINGPGTGCLYRTPDGYACAVGCLITDEEFATVLQRKVTWGTEANKCEVVDLFSEGIIEAPDDLKTFLIEAQNCHDNAQSVADFLANLSFIKPVPQEV